MPFYAINWHKWWYCITISSASRSLLYRVQSANLKFSLLGLDTLGVGQLGQFVVAIWWCILVEHIGGAYCKLVRLSDWVICLVS